MFLTRKIKHEKNMPSTRAWNLQNRLQTLKIFPIMMIIIFIPSPMLVIVTFSQMSHIYDGAHSKSFYILVIIDLIYIFMLTTIMAVRIIRISRARSKQRSGARFHMRLTLFFILIALLPTLLAAAFAMLTINISLEGWFSEKVRKAMGASLTAAQAYQSQQQKALIDDATKLAVRINITKDRLIFIPAGDLRNILESEQSAIQRGLKEAYIIDGTGEIRARGARSYLFDYEKPSEDVMIKTQNEGIQLIKDWENGELRVLLQLDSFIDRYLYVSRSVDKKILVLLDDTQETVRFYKRLEKDRNNIQFGFMFLYLFVATNIVVISTMLGLWIAERISQRVGLLTKAVREVGKGNLDVRIDEIKDLDEISTLGQIFNQMTKELSSQRRGLMKINLESEKSRRFFDSVLSNISAGVIGLDSKGNVEFINQTAREALDLKKNNVIGENVKHIAPEFVTLFQTIKSNPDQVTEEQIRLARHRYIDDFFVRARTRKNKRGFVEGFILAFDNVTELVLAQRMAAWGDVARRIAHEIKNPLTPIRLAAERIRNYVNKNTEANNPTLVEMTNVVVRQTNDIARIVNEFSKFARMPKPIMHEHNIVTILRDTIALQSTKWNWIKYETNFPSEKVLLPLDENLMSQAFSNLLKNACESIQAKRDQKINNVFSAEIHILIKKTSKNIKIMISDNGIGLPAERSTLFEPYVSHRADGTGLGLSIVRKIIEEHGGTLILKDAEIFYKGDNAGALVEITLPKNTISKN